MPSLARDVIQVVGQDVDDIGLRGQLGRMRWREVRQPEREYNRDAKCSHEGMHSFEVDWCYVWRFVRLFLHADHHTWLSAGPLGCRPSISRAKLIMWLSRG